MERPDGENEDRQDGGLRRDDPASFAGEPVEESRGDPVENSQPLEVPAARGSIRRLTLLLLLLLAAVGLFAGTTRSVLPDPAPRGNFGRALEVPQAPPAQRATGPLADVYREARDAALRIESRCANPLFGGSPIDVGTGFFVTPEGGVLTAYHVVRRQAPSLAVPGGCSLHYVALDSRRREYPLELTAFDAYRDIALMQARTTEPVPYLELADELPRVGAEVLAIGNSRGEFLADRSGSVTRLGVRADRVDFASGTIELTAALAPGDSGGPVLGEDGRVLGVVSYISFDPSILTTEGETPLSSLFGAEDTPEFASYAVPALAGSRSMAGLMAGEMRDVPVIGFEMAFEYDPRGRGMPALGRRPGVVVGRVQQGGPGDLAGLRSFRERTIRTAEGVPASQVSADVIVAVDGVPTPSFERLLEVVRERSVGEEITLTVQRDGQTARLDLELAGYRQIFR